MGKRTVKHFELFDADGYSLANYETAEIACIAAEYIWKLRWGWCIYKITKGKKQLYYQTFTSMQLKMEGENK